MLETTGLMLAGWAMLLIGADALVKCSSRVALALGVSPLVIGLTLVAFGTSAPELAVSVTSAWSGVSDIAVANVVGSNIFNVLAILGLSALFAPLAVNGALIRVDLPVMIGSSFLLLFLSIDRRIDLWDSIVLTVLIFSYTWFLISQARREHQLYALANGVGDNGSGRNSVARSLLFDALKLMVALAMLTLGSKVLVNASVELSRLLGISEAIIGLTIVAAGTSLPELATSVVAALRGKRDIAIGNVIGSNTFNICCVLGFSGTASVGTLTVAPNMISEDIPLMTCVALICLPFFRSGHILTRANGAIFLFGYGLYLLFLALRETHDPGLELFESILFSYLLPILVIGTVSVLVTHMRNE